MSTDSQLPELERASRPFEFLSAAVPLSLLLAAASLFLFAWIAEEVAAVHTLKMDVAARNWVHHNSSPGLTAAAKFASFMGAEALSAAFVVSLLLFAFLNWRTAALWMTIAMLGALILDLSLKHAFHRQRPAPFFGSLPHSYSFPSGHALFSFCFYGMLAGLMADRIESKPAKACIWSLAAVLVLTIGFSRIYLGVHYPTDVIGGYLAAGVWVGCMIGFDHVRKRKRRFRS